MISKIKLKNYKKYDEAEFYFNAGRNILVGDNNSGKSSLLQAISLVLNGSYSQVENIGLINLFNSDSVDIFCKLPVVERTIEKLPVLYIELYFDSTNEKIKDNFNLYGKHNSEERSSFGVRLLVEPNLEQYGNILLALSDESMTFPYEYYGVKFQSFCGADYNSYSKPHKFKYHYLDTSLVDTKKEIDKHISMIYEKSIGKDNQAKINHSFRQMSDDFIKDMINQGILQQDEEYKLLVNNNSNTSFKDKATVKNSGVDIRNFGQGEKVLLSVRNMYSTVDEKVGVVLIEEPENHLSFLKMHTLLDYINRNNETQLFISTHSNMIASRLGLDNCTILHGKKQLKLDKLDKETVKFFNKTSNQNILNFILSNRSILVEGDSEYILLEKMYEIVNSSSPSQDEIMVVSVSGLSFKRYLNVAKELNKKVVVITDNDGNYQKNVVERYQEYEDCKEIKVLSQEDSNMYTFEVSLFNQNQDWIKSKRITKSPNIQDWMLNNKSESAIRILEKLEDNTDGFKVPDYIRQAVKWIKN
jgi:recF/recN/SMC N domain protein